MISQDKGRVWMSESQVSSLDMNLANHSYLQLESTDIDSLSANIDQSQAYVDSPLGLVRATVINESVLRLNSVRALQLTRDENSNVNLY